MESVVSDRRKRFGRTASRIIRLFVMLVVAGAVLISAVSLTMLASDSHADPSTVVAVVRVTALVLAGFLLLLFLLCGVSIVRWLGHKRKHEEEGVSRRSIIVGLAVAAFLFPKGTYALLVTVPLFAIATIEACLSGVVRPHSYFLSEIRLDGATSGDVLVGQLAYVSGSILSAIGASAERMITDFPWRDGVFALATILLVARSLGTWSSATDRRRRMIDWWHGLSSDRRSHFVAASLIFVSIYLSIAAIIAIPWLTDESDSAFLSAERLQARLAQMDESVSPFASFDAVASDTLPTVAAIARLVDALNQADTTLQFQGVSEATWMPFLNQLKIHAAGVLPDRRRTVPAATAQVEKVRQESKAAAEDAIARFDMQLSQQMTTAERAIYFERLVEWVRSSHRRASFHANRLEEMLGYQDASVQRWVEGMVGTLSYAVAHMSAVGQDTVGHRSVYLSDFFPPIEGLRPTYSLPMMDESILFPPEPPQPGEGWGPFAVVAMWLLRTKSVALAQIAGMLGFGLFGAVISVQRWRTGIRAARKNAQEDGSEVAAVEFADIEGEFGTILTAGFSATLVVFLAVNGGLAIVNEGTSSPNSYVLFFSCFVGAVYSQDVWAWAQARLVQALQR
jgi:hypothetical protein